jgi:type I restriction enzyme S subunit
MSQNYPYYGASGIIDYVEEYIYDEPTILVAEDGANLLSRSTDLAFIAEGKYWVNNHAHILKPIQGEFSYWANLLCIVQYDTWITGSAQPKLSKDNLGSIPLPHPPELEQQKIADFLDYKTQQIDQLIEKKKALIEKLNEQRIAVITQAVTKGIDKNAKMKPSGVDWLGDVPEHWEIKSIKRMSIVRRGASPRPIQDLKYFDDEGEYAWVRIADVTSNDHYLLNTTQRLSELGKSYSVPLQPGTLFLSIAGSVGKPMITSIKCCIHDGFVYFPYLTDSPEYLYYIFISGQCYLGLGKLGTQLNLNTDTVGGIKVGLPALAEQKIIVNYLNSEMEKIDQMILLVNGAVTKLEEYRSATITAAVTGKIDIRNIEIPCKEAAI